MLDPDGDGELTREEIQRGLDIVEYEVTDDDADAMLNYADRCASIISGEDLEMTGDGKVMQHEFVSFMGHPGKTPRAYPHTAASNLFSGFVSVRIH